MSASLLSSKLKLKEDTNALILNKPDTLDLGVAYDSSSQCNTYDFALLFANNSKALNDSLPEVLNKVIREGIIWIAYPKKSANISTDLDRDKGWDILNEVYYRVVSQVAIDDNWSALRIKPLDAVKSSSKAQHQIFKAVIEGSKSGAWVKIPFNVEQVFGEKGIIKVKAKFDGHNYRGSIANMGNGPMLIVKKEIRTAINKDIGDKVLVEIKKDTETRTVAIPVELEKLLEKNPMLKEFYNSLSFTNRKEYAQWIAGAKKEATKEKRLNETKRRLKAKIKNPFEK